MNTPTHALINWTVARWWGEGSFPKRAVLLGSIAPDIPLYLLSFGGIIYFGYIQGHDARLVGDHLYGNLFYNDATWITLHNFLHSPTVLLMIIGVLVWRRQRAFWKSAWSWFFASCLLHTLVDIPVHHDDGPLVFWPFNWTYRFASPVSYWDPSHFGIPMMIGECILAIALAAAILLRWYNREPANS